jgi:tetratricopeptide (TPR) repeat protein
MRRLEKVLRHHWRERRLVIILDDFEQNLDIPAEGEARLHPLAAALLEVLVPACLEEQPKLLITSTARFALPARLQGALAEVELGALEGASVRKLWFRGADGHQLAHFLPSEDWARLSERLGRNARILDWARQLLAGKTPKEVREIATRAGQQLPVWTDSAPDKAKQDELVALFLKHMAFEEAQAKVGPDALAFIERARVYEDPVPEEALAGLMEGLFVSLDRHLVALANLGLLEVGREGDTRVYRVSPLVKEVFDAPDGERWHAVAAAYWWKAAPGHGGWNAPAVLRTWRHALQAKHQALADEAASIIHPWLDSQGNFAESAVMGQQHITAFPNSIVGLLWVGYARFRAGQPREGLPLLRRGVELAKSLPGEHARLPQARDLLARVLASLGAHTEARQQFEELVAAEEQAHPDGNHSLASALHELAGVLQAQGDLPAARSLLERSLLIKKKVLGTEEHPSVSASLHALAVVLQAQGDLPAARSLLERSIGIDKKVLGTEEHHEVAVSYANLASCLQAQGLLDESEASFRRALTILERVHRTRDHYMIAEAEVGLSFLLFSRDRQEEALPLLQHALPVLHAQVPNHPLLRQFQQLASAPAVNPTHLARSALAVRREGRTLPEELLAGLHSLRSTGEVHNQVADFLEQLARGGPLPPVPPGLPEDAAAFIAAVRQAAEETSSQP